MPEKKVPYLGVVSGPTLVVLDALCHGRAQDRECGNDLSPLIVAACRGEPKRALVVLCPLCRNQVTVRLNWQPALLCRRPEVTAE